MREEMLLDDNPSHIVHVRKQRHGSSSNSYHITLYNPGYVPLRDWHDEYSKRALNALLDDIQRQYQRLNTFFIDPFEDIDIIFSRLKGDLCHISAWYRPNRSVVPLKHHHHILMAVQSIASMVKHEALPLTAYYTGEVRLLKSRLWWDFYEIQIIENCVSLHDTFKGWYTSEGLSDEMYRRYPDLQTYHITWPLRNLDGVLIWTKTAIQSFRANYTEHGHRLSNSQKGILREILHHLEELIQE